MAAAPPRAATADRYVVRRNDPSVCSISVSPGHAGPGRPVVLTVRVRPSELKGGDWIGLHRADQRAWDSYLTSRCVVDKSHPPRRA